MERSIISKSEEFNLIDEENEWNETTTERRVYKWIGGRLYPGGEKRKDTLEIKSSNVRVSRKVYHQRY